MVWCGFNGFGFGLDNRCGFGLDRFGFVVVGIVGLVGFGCSVFIRRGFFGLAFSRFFGNDHGLTLEQRQPRVVKQGFEFGEIAGQDDGQFALGRGADNDRAFTAFQRRDGGGNDDELS